MKDAWNPAQYGRFSDERSRPFFDLAAMVKGPVANAVDLGCGPGRLTAELPALLGTSDLLGIDNSPAMLEEAKQYAKPGLRFELGDLARFEADRAYDLVFSNAGLQWSPGHPALLARLAAALRPGGQLAVQVPANADHEGASLADQVAHEEPFFSALGGAPPPDTVTANVLSPEAYAVILHRLGFAEQRVHLEVYLHLLESTTAVVDWLRGASLTRFAKLLPPDVFEQYLGRVRARLLEEVGDQRPYPFTFKRIFLWAKMPS